MSTRAIEAGRAVVRASLDDAQLARGLKRAQAKLKKFGASVQALGARLAKFGLLLAAPFAVSAKIFADFSDSMLEVSAKVGATSEQMKQLTEVAKTLGATTSFTAKQAAEGMVLLAQAGFKTNEIISALPDILNLARATSTDLASAAEIAAQSLKQFGLEASEAGRVADVLTGAANNSNQTLLDLGEALSKVGPVANSLGLSIEDVAASIAILADVGIKGSLGGTALKIAFQNLAKTPVQKALRDIGVEITKTESGTIKLSDIMANLLEKTKDLGKLEKLNIFQTLFGRASVAAIALSSANVQFSDMKILLKSLNGIAKRTAEIMDSELGGSIRRLLSAVAGVAIEIGEALNDELKELARILTNAAGSIRVFIKENKTLVVSLGVATISLGVFATALIGIGIAIQVAGGVAGLTTKLVGLNVALNAITTTSLIGGLARIGPIAKVAGATLLRLALASGPLVLLAGGIGLVTFALLKWFGILDDSDALEKTTKKIERLNKTIGKQKELLQELSAQRVGGRTETQGDLNNAESLVKSLAKQGQSEKEILATLEKRLKENGKLIIATEELGAAIFDSGKRIRGLPGIELRTEILIADNKAIRKIIEDGIGNIVDLSKSAERITKELAEKQLAELQKNIEKQKKALVKFEKFRANLAKERGERAAEEEFELRLAEVPVQALAEASQAYAKALEEAGKRVKEAQDAIKKAATAPDDITKAQAAAAFDAAKEAERQVDRQAQMLQAAGAAVAAVRDDAVRDLENFATKLSARNERKTREAEEEAFGELVKVQPGKALAVATAELAAAEKESVKEIAEAQAALKAARESGKKSELERAQVEIVEAEEAIRAVDRLENFVRKAGDEVARRLSGAQRAIGTATFSALAAGRIAGGIADPIQKAQLNALGKIVKNGGKLLLRFDELTSLGTLG